MAIPLSRKTSRWQTLRALPCESSADGTHRIRTFDSSAFVLPILADSSFWSTGIGSAYALESKVRIPRVPLALDSEGSTLSVCLCGVFRLDGIVTFALA